jgi:hypothetical protein
MKTNIQIGLLIVLVFVAVYFEAYVIDYMLTH